MPKFKVGDVCIWQNIINSKSMYLNGSETTITKDFGPVKTFSGKIEQSYITDTPWGNGFLIAKEHHLRLKKPPTTGEEIIRTMFLPKPVLEPA